ncbi:MAG TPA: prolyl oligopeptidase family serine peptidase [Longimicrobiales bacterium]|nr:prolyl oligopeptidase family serine peptidase [Longimicrobiales bacterium]
MMRSARWMAVALGSVCLLAPVRAAAQGTLEDYRRASHVLDGLSDLAVNVAEPPTWIDAGRFWYRKSVTGGNEFVLVDAATGAKRPPFDHARLASALSSAADTGYTAVTLPFSDFSFADGESAVEVEARGSRWRCTLAAYQCTRVGAAREPDGFGARGRFGRPRTFRSAGEEDEPPTPSTACLPPEAATGRGAAARGPGAGPRFGDGARAAVTSCISPDGRLEAFVQNYNVAVRPARRPEARRPTRPAGFRGVVPAEPPDYAMLSYDGSEGDAYQLMSIRWSPDSKRLVAYRRRPGYDRMVHYVLSSPADQLQPRDTAIFYRKPGDVLDVIEPVLIDVESRKATPVDNSLFPNEYQISQAVWRKDGHAFTFEYNQRGHQVYRVIEVDAATGKARALISEEVGTFFFYRPVGNPTDSGKKWRFDVDDGREILWMSERDGWNHLYLYDGATGRVKNQVTRGPWVVRAVDSVDVAKRQVYFRASGMIPGQDPYFMHYYRINFDGTGLVKYTEADGNHALYWSPDGAYYVDMYSRVDLPTVMELRRVSDMRRTPLEKGDMSAMLATGWRPPEVFTARGRDGKTDIWGIIVRPTNFDPSRKYPVVEQIYAGPQGNFVPKSWGGGLNLQPMAELGFILVQIDGMGTNNRSKAFHDVAWKNLGDAGFPDRILWHEAVAAKHPWYDITRVGLYGTSAGGQNAMGGVLFHPEFYKAAYANSGCHDNRMDKIWWNELWMSWPLGPQYEASSNVVNAHRLQGHLMLVIGEFDTNVDPSSGYQVVNALIQAGKVFDLLVVPNGGHGAGGEYAIRKRNDFFVHWLLGSAPPDWNAEPALVQRATGLDFPADPAMDPSFYDGPNDPPYVWWGGA